MKRLFFLFFTLIMTTPVFSQSEWQLRFMPQAAFGGRNTIQRPNDGQGTRINLNNEFDRKNKATFSPRIELEYNYNRHHIIATVALVNDKFEGTTNRDIKYNEILFNAGNHIETKYKFNTYRIGYRYRLADRPQWVFEIGATVLFRDAYISMKDNTRDTKYTNFGVAPLLSYYLEWKATEQFSLLTYGDAFAVKAGRAEDIFIGGKYQFTSNISGIAGYRILEGGSDGDKVYTMATFHFASVGIGFNF